MRSFLSGLIITFGALLCGVAQGHDLQGIVSERNALDSETKAKFDEIAELRRLLAARAAANPADGQLEAVIQRVLRWPGGRATVCFFDGRNEARENVAKVAESWMQGTGLVLDFGSAGSRRTCDVSRPSDIRVSFYGSGYWSYVGTQAKYITPYKQTLNLQGMDSPSLGERDTGIILHEFGHAIGFEHEHQSPIAGCDSEFNWNYLYVAMGWSREEVDRNMRKLNLPSSRTALLVTPFDSKSVMLYSLPPQSFKDPRSATCYIPNPNNKISEVDRDAAAIIYPSVAPASAPPMSAATPATPNEIAFTQSLERLKKLSDPEMSR